MVGLGLFGVGQTMNVLAVIPARGGSKGIPRKNVYPLNGKPLIAYTLEAARQAQRVTWAMVSTDDEEIATVARAWGGKVPFMRPAHLAQDDTPQIEVVLHAVAEMQQRLPQPIEAVLLLQPTAPLRTAADIDQSLQLLTDTQADSVVSFHKIEDGHPYYMYTIENGEPHPLLEIPPSITRRQQFPPVYLRNGAIYAVRRDVLVNQRTFYGARSQAYVMPVERSVNIDTELDLQWVEFLLQRRSVEAPPA